ncbi:MAG TPA: hypothetical protein VLZ74_08435 [Methylocella sp.]|nr:hypothetical protein [Methylocella sp.]
MIDLDVKMPSERFIETIQKQIAQLEALETTGTATLDTYEVLANLHELLDKLYTMFLEVSRETFH